MEANQLPTKPGPYYWRKSDGDEWARVFDVQLSNSMGLCVDAGFYYESVEQRGGQWLPIPTAEELVELLRLVDEVTGWENDLIDTNEFPVDGEAMINDIGNLREYAEKIRKEIGA